MKLDQIQAFENHLERVSELTGRSISCPVCGGGSLRTGSIVEPVRLSGPPMQASDAPVALIQYVCQQCHHVLHFDCKDCGVRVERPQ